MHKPLDNVLYLFIDTSAPGKHSETIQFNQAIIEDNRNLFIIMNLLEATSTVLTIYHTNAVNIRLTVCRWKNAQSLVFFSCISFSWGVLSVNYSYTLMGVCFSNISGFFWLHPLLFSLGTGFHYANYTLYIRLSGAIDF